MGTKPTFSVNSSCFKISSYASFKLSLGLGNKPPPGDKIAALILVASCDVIVGGSSPTAIMSNLLLCLTTLGFIISVLIAFFCDSGNILIKNTLSDETVLSRISLRSTMYSYIILICAVLSVKDTELLLIFLISMIL